MNQYETVFILSPVLSENQVKETVGKFRSHILDNSGELIHEEDWGLRKLAYPIKNKSTGFYHLFEFKAPGAFINSLETEYRRDESVIRFLSSRLDKYSVAYAEKRRMKQRDAANDNKEEQSDNTKKEVNS